MSIFRRIPLLIFHLIFILVVLGNFPWGKYFIGWDNLLPELNFSINFQRSLTASWQENYGAGVFGGHGFAATLPHNLIVWLFSLVLPINAIRPFFTFLCLYLGGLGLYFLIMTITEIEWAALAGALFYMFNLGTRQMFYVPLEAFIVQFAALPWLFWIIIRLFEKSSPKNLLLLFLINFLASIQGFIPQLFLVYLLALGLFLFISRKSYLIFLLTLVINSYWFLPFGYYSLARSGITANAYNNLLSTQDFIGKSQQYGNFGSLVFLKGFYLDSHELGGFIFQPWIDHYQKPLVAGIWSVFFGIIIIGVVGGLLLLKKKWVKGFLGVFLLFFSLLASDIFPFSYLHKLLTFWPVLSQAFRTIFTKAVIGLSFAYSLFFAIGIMILFCWLKKIGAKKFWVIVWITLFIGLIYGAKPIFNGNLLYKKLIIDFPKNYLDLFEFFSGKENGRIADFPQGCSEGWYAYNWGYFGSGFLGYGLKQPIMARTFDVWGNFNENYYWEVSQALNEQNWEGVDKILTKYDIKWVLYDPNLKHCRSPKALINNDSLVSYLANSPKYRLVKIFSQDGLLPIKIFENQQENLKSFVSLKGNLPEVGPIYRWTSQDQAYQDLGDYVSASGEQATIFYPFRSLFTGRKQEELEFGVEDKGDYFSFTANIPKNFSGAKLTVPQLSEDELVQVDKDDLSKTIQYSPQVLPAEGILEVRVPKIKGYYSWDSQEQGALFNQMPKSCDQFNQGIYKQERVNDWLRLTSLGSSNCLDFDLGWFTQKQAYLVKIESRSIKGRSLLFSVVNKTSQRNDLETYLPQKPTTSYFVTAPMQVYGQGYGLHFDNISIGRVETVNDLGRVEIYPVPYKFLKSLKLIRETEKTGKVLAVGEVSHPNPSFYKVRVGNVGSVGEILVLSQNYDPGWLAWDGKFLKHVLVNNWENGWVLRPAFMRDFAPQGQTIYLFYWPQVLEYIGFGLLIGGLGWLILGKRS